MTIRSSEEARALARKRWAKHRAEKQERIQQHGNFADELLNREPVVSLEEDPDALSFEGMEQRPLTVNVDSVLRQYRMNEPKRVDPLQAEYEERNRLRKWLWGLERNRRFPGFEEQIVKVRAMLTEQEERIRQMQTWTSSTRT